jgi:hypothetical protein
MLMLVVVLHVIFFILGCGGGVAWFIQAKTLKRGRTSTLLACAAGLYGMFITTTVMTMKLNGPPMLMMFSAVGVLFVLITRDNVRPTPEESKIFKRR